MFVPANRIARWAESLSASSAWVAAVNAAFDHIGFTDDYIAQTERSTIIPRAKAVKDHIWGMVELDPLAARILDSPVMQRLRWVHQTGLTYVTYPTANHSRFEHSIGVYHVVSRLLESFRKTEEIFRERARFGDKFGPTAVSYPANSRESKLITLAALLHDVGHVAFSHLTEKIFLDLSKDLKIGPFTIHKFREDFSWYYRGMEDSENVETSPEIPLSEIVSVALINQDRFRRFYKACTCSTDIDEREDLCNIGALIFGDRIDSNDFALPEILSGSVDADKIDYLVRDSQACGISTGIDVARVFFRAGVYESAEPESFMDTRFLKSIITNKPVRVFVIDQSGSDALREMGQARVSLYQRVYHHHLTRNAETHFREIIKNSLMRKNNGKFCKNLLNFFFMTESEILRRLVNGDSRASTRHWARAILIRLCFCNWFERWLKNN